jgi:thymidylate synthase (FAD)
MKKFTIQILNKTELPQQTIWSAMHQDYSENFVLEKSHKFPDEQKAGDLVVRHLLKGNKGHYGCLEHPVIVVNAGYFPHSLMQQIRTHRLLSFDCQSFRYTGNRILEAAENKKDIEDVFYIRPVGVYTDRQGKKYYYNEEQREEDLEWCLQASKLYAKRIKEGVSEEQARSILPFDVRQHFVMSCNMRSLMHILDLRWKKDAQLEAQIFSEHLFSLFKIWSPEIADWYYENRAKKARLSP